VEAIHELASRADRRLVYFRLVVVVINTLMYFALNPGLVRWPSAAIGIMAFSFAYVLGLIVLQSRLNLNKRWFGGLVPAFDGILMSLWIAVTGGFHSPYFIVYYVGIVGAAFTYATFFIYGLSLFYVASYAVVCLAVSGGFSVSELIFRSLFMVFAAAIGELIVGESVAQATNRARYEENMAEAERTREIFRNVQDQLESAVERRTRELESANKSLEAEIQKRIQIEDALKKAAADTERANKAKSEFLANVSHEIRTPLSAVIGYSELLAETVANPDERALYAETVRRNGKLLGAIIGDILDLSKIESGNIPLEMSDVVVRDMLEDIGSLFRRTIEEKGLLFRVIVDDEVPETFFTDATRLKQILVNLVSNAVKFTERGTVVVRVSVNAGEHGVCTVKFAISDTGVGVSPEKQSRIFDPFTQADSSTSKKHGGTGLGLTISRKLAEKMYGSLILERSSENSGSTFSLILPIPETQVRNIHRQTAAVQTLPAGELAGRTILLVDDALDNQVLLKHLLEKSGAQRVDLAEDGVGAIRLGSANSYDVILMDLQMPRVDGFQATNALRRLGVTTPIIAVTAHAMSEMRERALAEGFSGFIAKPVMRGALISVISDILRQRNLQPQVQPADSHA
jgi:signal transduction histidine kinase/CheY-like chemotaxis protein